LNDADGGAKAELDEPTGEDDEWTVSRAGFQGVGRTLVQETAAAVPLGLDTNGCQLQKNRAKVKLKLQNSTDT